MTALTLSSELTSVLETEAERSGTTITALVETWLRQHYATLRREQLAMQTKRFQAKQAELYTTYPEQYAAFYDDQVLDHGDDLRQLALREKTNHGLLPVVIALVTASPVLGYRIRSPRLQHSIYFQSFLMVRTSRLTCWTMPKSVAYEPVLKEFIAL